MGSGDLNFVARWDGGDWRAVGDGLTGPTPAVRAIGSFEGRLHVGGDFTSAGGSAVGRIASWDGRRWTALGSGMEAGVYALRVHDDGGGPALFAGGAFASAGGVLANRIARWDGSSWTALGEGVGGTATTVQALEVFDDGSGPALFAGGNFTSAGGVSASRIARWDGGSWAAVGSGIGGGFSVPNVRALAVHDDGAGLALYAAGNFTTAGGVPADDVARWDGTSWSAVGLGPRGSVHALAVFERGQGPELFAGGSGFVDVWNGTEWEKIGDLDDGVYALAVFDEGEGDALYAAGDFTVVDGMAASRIARWDGMGWSALGSGLTDPASTRAVRALAVGDPGFGPALLAGGDFELSPAGDAYIATWGRAPKLRRATW